MIQALIPELNHLVFSEGRPADVVLSNHLKNHKELGSRDRRFLSQTTFSFFRWHGWTIARLKLPFLEACFVSAALDSNEFDDSYTYMAKQCKLPCRIEPVGSLSLEDKCATMNQWFSQRLEGEALSLLDLVPEGFDSLIEPEAVKHCIKAFQQRPPVWIRLRGMTDTIEQALAEKQVGYVRNAMIPTALAIQAGINLNSAIPNQAAQFVVQDIASQCVGIIAAPNPGEEWWDCCAGAGGKTIHLADLMNGEGKILSTDIRLPALKELKKRIRKLGIRGVRTQPFNAVHDEPFRKTFDGVLVDAPCSGWGTWNRNPDARLRSDRRDVQQCSTRQKKILNNAAWCVNPGGKLIYAICSITRPESEEVISLFLTEHPDFKLEPFINPLTGKECAGMCQLWPFEGPGDGMFIARMTRTRQGD
jgi:16S rRNA (cytosine967-C5)-methyltransferase